MNVFSNNTYMKLNSICMFHSRKICPFNVTDSKWGQHLIWEFNSCFFFTLSYCIAISALSFVDRHLAAELGTKFYRQLIFEKLSFSAFYLKSQAVCWMEGKPLKKPRRRRIWKRRSRHFHFHSELLNWYLSMTDCFISWAVLQNKWHNSPYSQVVKLWVESLKACLGG